MYWTWAELFGPLAAAQVLALSYHFKSFNLPEQPKRKKAKNGSARYMQR